MSETLQTPVLVYGPASPADAAAMRAIRGDNWLEYARTNEETAAMEAEVQRWCGPVGVAAEEERIQLANDEGLYSNFYYRVVHDTGGNFVAYLAGVRDSEDKPGYQEITALHVAKGWTGAGIGSSLLKAFFWHLGTFRPTILSVVTHARAVTFYAKHGFVELNEPPGKWAGLDVQWLVREAG